MLYQIPNKTTTPPKWLTATLIIIYVAITALLFINGSEDTKPKPVKKGIYTHAVPAYTKTQTAGVSSNTN